MGTRKRAARNKKTAVAAPENPTAPGSQGSGAVVVAQGAFSGPLPPPRILADYDEVVPGAAERILKMAEQQATHRQELERRVIKADIAKSYLGIAAAFVLG